MLRIPVAFALALSLAGCAGLQDRPRDVTRPSGAPASAAEAVALANDLGRRGRWSDAIRLLDGAAQRFPDDRALLKERQSLQLQWEREEQSLEDRIMVGEAESQRDKIKLLEKLSLAEPDNLLVTSRRIYWKEVLAGKLEQLTACGERHASASPVLARRCLELASSLPATAGVETRLARVSEQLRASEHVAAERRRASEEKERQARAKSLLESARQAIEASEYRAALDMLAKVAELQPNNSDVAGLREEALAMISPQVEALVKLGDHLYLDEQLDAAVATWKAALSLKPGDEDIVSRIERAKTVLDRLDALRRQQKSPLEVE